MFLAEQLKEYWESEENGHFWQIIRQLEADETWTVMIDEELDNHLQTIVEQAQHDQLDSLSAHDFVSVLIWLPAGASIRFLQLCEERCGGFTSRILSSLESSESAEEKMFYQRHLMFERWQLVYRLFARERFGSLVNYLENIDL